MERIGIYGGTFDPVHTGHLILARDAVERLDLARMIFVPAARSPHKLGRAPGAPGEVRLEMLRAAIAGESRFEVDPCELGRAGPSFTIDTIQALRARLPGGGTALPHRRGQRARSCTPGTASTNCGDW